jgi:hypothetical protein
MAAMTIPAIAPPDIPLLELLPLLCPPEAPPAVAVFDTDTPLETLEPPAPVEVLLVEEVVGDRVEKALGVDFGKFVTMDADGKAANSFALASAGETPEFGFGTSLGMHTLIWLGVVVHDSASPQHHCRAFDFPQRI